MAQRRTPRPPDFAGMQAGLAIGRELQTLRGDLAAMQSDVHALKTMASRYGKAVLTLGLAAVAHISGPPAAETAGRLASAALQIAIKTLASIS